jgi:hypothetical protein
LEKPHKIGRLQQLKLIIKKLVANRRNWEDGIKRS